MSVYHVGIDIGSTTAKSVVLDDDDIVIHSTYSRHFADIRSTADKIMQDIAHECGVSRLTMSLAGSGALGMAEGLDVPFTQELVACSKTVERYLDGVDVAIELGGEDAKLTFFDASGVDQRMNETCAGGTGAFIDQMSALLGTDAAGLNELAKGHKTIYPIASRCGVFAKTDIQPLLNDGAAKEDLAASIFQAIVNQTISGLACGRKIKGRVAFLGGPLYFLSELRKRFVETLGLTEDQYIFPKNPHLFVAIGAALMGKHSNAIDIGTLQSRAMTFFSSYRPKTINILPALFVDEGARRAFTERHSANRTPRVAPSEYRGRGAYLGIDVGSTTIKVVLIGDDGEILFSRYCVSSSGEPVSTVRGCLEDMYREIGTDIKILRSCVTGYGEKLIRAAFGLDLGEVETVAHARAADHLLPGAGFVIDIGGQDMKCLGIKDGVITKVFLNEACSSGCGSFLQTFAESLGMSIEDFARAAEESLMPVDLGSRCTVFMNSRVRQAQKEGASVADISSGLVYSIVRNALYKVLKIRSMDDLGEKVVVQGGAFKNDALLRAFELVTGKEVVRPDISELMGAYGAALIARESAEDRPDIPSATMGADDLRAMHAHTSTHRCGGCGNNCILTCTRFSDGRRYISGNRCEKGGAASNDRPQSAVRPDNIYKKKYERLFAHYTPRSIEDAPRGEIGIPRVLNMYENYPFWATFFDELGFRVVLSGDASDENAGIETIPSQTLCYPAKRVHHHICDLLSRGVKTIFYPLNQREAEEFEDAHKDYNCPVVVGYPDVAYLNIDELQAPDITYLRPALPPSLDGSAGKLSRRLFDELAVLGIPLSDIKRAARAAAAEQKRFKDDIREYGRAALENMKKNGGIGVVLAGHPYHLDPEVNHGIPDLITSYGVTVFTEDSVCDRASEVGGVDELYVVDQWVYHSRLYRVATLLALHPDFKDVHMIQLNSFGCGLDAISADQSAAILQRHGKMHTLIKIDEGKNTGAVNIRIRSLLASVKKRRAMTCEDAPKRAHAAERRRRRRKQEPVTMLCPPLSSHHFQFFETVMRDAGVDFRVLPEGGRDAVELALKYVNNDACYPAMVVVGQFLKALMSGDYDLDRVACFYAQTGGGCRASNYVPLLRRALDSAGFENVKIYAANAQENSGAEAFRFSLKTFWRSALALLYGDVLMKLILAVRPYEKVKNSANELYKKWTSIIKTNVVAGKWRIFKQHISDMVREFSDLPVDLIEKPKVGIVGEILVKYHANANERLVEMIEAEGGEAVVPDLTNFLLYCLMDNVVSNKLINGSLLKRSFSSAGISFFERLRAPIRKAFESSRFGPTHTIRAMAKLADGIVSMVNQAGEGWLLTAEMVNLIQSGVRNVICVQPFGCLPNHITGKGVIKELKRRFANANILPLDYDASVSNVNQINRIKLLMATAKI